MPTTPAGVGAELRLNVIKSLLWAAGAGLTLATMNAVMRLMTQQIDSFQAQFVRYAFGLSILIPILLKGSIRRLKPHSYRMQLLRGLVQVTALSLFFMALPHVPLADATAIMFCVPVFILLGAAIFLKEKVSLMRWFGAMMGFSGVLVVLWPHLSTSEAAGGWSLVTLASAPFFAAAFLLTKAMTRHDNNETLVAWLNISVAILAAPMALYVWQTPTQTQWGLLAVAGILGTISHFCFTKAFSMADISSLQPVRFLDLIWSSLLGFMIFANKPAPTALAGGAIIVAATIWMTRYETRRSDKAGKVDKAGI
ncbi:MAG: DMT family transporter [Burkholderiaceae bacterium]